MITKQLIRKVEDFVYAEVDKYKAPSRFHIDLANEKGQWLAKKLNANRDVVYLGTLLMDCMLGKAYSHGKLPEHVRMSVKKVEELLSQDEKITEEEKENILHCVKGHHGVKKFFSLESEIVCNSDCYRFSSVKGVLGGMSNMRDMNLDEMIKLYSKKADEKWNALSLDICKKELKPQYKAIKEMLTRYEGGEG